jgi:two-component system CheB/CheR fusion protein
MNVVYVHGRTGRFLEPPEGGANVNLLDMARPGLKTSLASCVRKVTRSRKETEQTGITLRSDGEDVSLDLVVKPIVDPRSLPGMSVVYFHVRESKPAKRSKDASLDRATYESEVVIELRQQLVDTQENLQSTIEELETANEELKSTNEELQSTNEELQSSNEELQTSKEELQSVNEESATVNAELSSRIDELARANDDLKNLLDSTGIATIFLDSDFSVRRFTPGVNDLIPLTATDVGRPLSHFSTSLLSVDLVGMARAVLDDLVIREQEVTTGGGRALLLRIRPYRTTLNVIDGTVLTFEDRTELRRAQDVLEARLTRNMKELSRAIDQLQRSEADRDEGKREQKTRRPRQEESE